MTDEAMFTKTETVRRLRALAALAREAARLGSRCPVEIGHRYYPVAVDTLAGTTVDALHGPADDDLEDFTPLADPDPADRRHGAIVHLYLSVRMSGGYNELSDVAVGWIGTPDADPVLVDVNGAPTAAYRAAAADPVAADRLAAMREAEAAVVDRAADRLAAMREAEADAWAARTTARTVPAGTVAAVDTADGSTFYVVTADYPDAWNVVDQADAVPVGTVDRNADGWYVSRSMTDDGRRPGSWSNLALAACAIAREAAGAVDTGWRVVTGPDAGQ